MGPCDNVRYTQMVRGSVYLLANSKTRKKWAKIRDSGHVFHRKWLPKAIFGRKPEKKQA